MAQNQSIDFAQTSLKNYLLDHAYDEMFVAEGELHRQYELLFGHFSALPADELQRRKQAADPQLPQSGHHLHRLRPAGRHREDLPYDLRPRIVTAAEWEKVEHGLMQRITALNLFLKEIYDEGRILHDGIVPREIVYSCRQYRRQMVGLQVHEISTSRSAELT